MKAGPYIIPSFKQGVLRSNKITVKPTNSKYISAVNYYELFHDWTREEQKEKRINEIETDAERKCKLQAIIESHPKRLIKSDKVCDDHAKMIRNIIRYKDKKL